MKKEKEKRKQEKEERGKYKKKIQLGKKVINIEKRDLIQKLRKEK